MRWTSKEVHKDEWHPWFAWHPVIVDSDRHTTHWTNTWAWLETVECKMVVDRDNTEWIYRKVEE